MDDGLKQRVVGAVVLLAIGVVFIPVVFDRERIEPVDRDTQIPNIPTIELVEFSVASTPLPVPSTAKPAASIFVPDEKKAVPEKPEPISHATNGTPNSWVLQIASYRFEGHAEQTRDKLIALGYAAYVRDVETERGKMTRLFVGPKIDKSVLIEAKGVIAKEFGVQPILLKFEP